uniref:Uncharacterized protein n=1 Tax=Arundo donax TaxID=35708 RepID=A0A0A8YMM7_ARUDO
MIWQKAIDIQILQKQMAS